MIYSKDKYEKCPVCGGVVVVQVDSDDAEHIWIHDVSRACYCEISVTVGLDGVVNIQDVSSKPNEVDLGY